MTNEKVSSQVFSQLSCATYFRLQSFLIPSSSFITSYLPLILFQTIVFMI